jgi:hypothetical protein
MLAFSAATASFFLLSFSAFFARPDSFLALAPLGGIVERVWPNVAQVDRCGRTS